MRARAFILVAIAVFVAFAGGVVYIALSGGSDERRVGALSRSYTTETVGISIDGVHAGYLKAMSCGAVGAEATRVAPGEIGGVDPKQLGPPMYEPCEVTFGLGMGKGLYSWIGEALAGKPSARNVSLSTYDADYKETGRLELMQAQIGRFSMPAFDAASNQAGTMTLIFRPQPIKAIKGSGGVGPAPKSSQKLWLVASFRFDFRGQPVTKVSKVTAWSFDVEADRPRLGDFTITISGSDPRLPELDEMLRSFVILGENGPKVEVAASIAMLDGTLTTTLAKLDFTGVGMSQGELLPAAAGDTSAKRQFSFYVEGASLTVGATY